MSPHKISFLHKQIAVYPYNATFKQPTATNYVQITEHTQSILLIYAHTITLLLGLHIILVRLNY